MNFEIKEKYREQLMKRLEESSEVIKPDKDLLKLLDELIFEKIYSSKLQRIVKVPIWTGRILGKIDLHELDLDGLLLDTKAPVSKYFNPEDVLAKKEIIEGDHFCYNPNFKTSNVRYDKYATVTDSKNCLDLNVDFSGWNLEIFLDQCLWYQALYKPFAIFNSDIGSEPFKAIDISGCDLSGNNLSAREIKVASITFSNLAGTNFFLNDHLPYLETLQHVNFEDNDFSKVIIDNNSSLYRQVLDDSNFLNFRNTGMQFILENNISHAWDSSRVLLYYTIRYMIQMGVLEGCFINNHKILSKEEIERKKVLAKEENQKRLAYYQNIKQILKNYLMKENKTKVKTK